MQVKTYVFCLGFIIMLYLPGNHSHAQVPVKINKKAGMLVSADPSLVSDVSLGAVSVTDGFFSNHNLLIDPGETGNLVVTLLNPSLVTATNVHVTLSTYMSRYVTVINDTADLENISPSSSRDNASTPFTFAIRPDVSCGTRLEFAIRVSFGGGASPKDIVFSVYVGSQGNSFAATLGSPVSGTGYHAITGKQTSRLVTSTSASNCLSNKFPGLLVPGSLAHQFDAYTFSNPGATSTCVTVSLQPSAGAQLSSVAYNRNGFLPQRPDANYLADIGPALSGTYSFNVAAGQAFTVVVMETAPGSGNNPNYTLTVSVPTCSPGPACSPVNITTANIETGETGKPYTQSFGTAGGSGNYVYTFKGDLPAGLSFKGNVLAGTPTQAGSFPFLVSSTDNICGVDTNAYILVVKGEVAATVSASAGTLQEARPFQEFPVQFQATVLNSSGVPMPGVNVIFSSPRFGPSGQFRGYYVSSADTSVTMLTDSNGIATAPVFIANSFPGSYRITATVVGAGTFAVYNLSNTCPSNLIVTSNADSGPGSLRDIVNDACDNQVITFDSSIHQITLTSGELLVSRRLTIQGPGADRLRISGNHLSRVFNLNNYITISGVTISDGKTNSTDVRGGGGLLINGGMIYIIKCHITNNDVSSSVNSLGGGILIDNGLIFIQECSITGNTALQDGGGIYNRGMTSISRSTIAENYTGPSGRGGGLVTTFLTSINESTIFGNSAHAGGNLYRVALPPDSTSSGDFSAVSINNTIIAGGKLLGSGGYGPDVSGEFRGPSGVLVGPGIVTLNADAPNLLENTNGALIISTVPQVIGLDPNLLPLANYGGPLPVMLPQPNSAAINTGKNLALSANDQRGFPRVSRGVADIGSVEANYSTTVISGTPQKAPITRPFQSTLQARVSESGKVVEGVAVTFSAPLTGASGTFPGPSFTVIDTTDVNGTAVAPQFTANDSTGSYHVSGKIGLAFDSVIYYLTNRKHKKIKLAEIGPLPGNGSTTLNWEADAQTTNNSFTVEYSTTGKTYSTLGTVSAAGDVRTIKSYQFTHIPNVQGTLYYRIKQTEAGNEVVYSNVVRLERNTDMRRIIAFPNPVRSELTIVIPGTGMHSVIIEDGGRHRIKQMNLAAGSHRIDASNWASGLYTVTIFKDGKIVEVLKVVRAPK